MKPNLVRILGSALCLLAASAGYSDEPQIGMIIPSGSSAATEINSTVAIDYGTFRWVVIPQTEFELISGTVDLIRVVARPYELDLGGALFDPLISTPYWPLNWRHEEVDREDFGLVQMIGPSRVAWLDGLHDIGLQVVQYIHPFTYVVWGKPTALSSGRIAEGVRWVGSFDPAFRVSPRWRELGPETIEVRLLIFRGASIGGVLSQVEGIGGQATGRRIVNDRWEIAGFEIAGDLLSEVASIPGVFSVQLLPADGGDRGEMSGQVNVNQVDLTSAAFPGYLNWLDGVGLHGAGVVIANVDSGVQEDHPDLISRFLPCVGVTCGGAATSSHGTHTAGIMAADGSSGIADGGGFLRGLGVAPASEMVEQVYSPHFNQPGGMLLLMEDSFANGAEISGNSWGPSGSPHGYDIDTLQVDVGVRDSDPNAPGNQALNYVLSFMNGYGGTSSQGTPDEAKNIFTIGSTKMQNSDLSQILAIDDLSANSAHGPALDGRTIPHMVAPGCSVDSTVPTDTYGTKCGTSMASPHVAGSVALFIESRRATDGVDPSPALVKAAFTAVAHDLAGNLDADGGVLGHPFDSKQGWGRLDLEAVLQFPDPVLYRDLPAVFGDTGEFWGMNTAVSNPSKPVRIMLVWTDAPGHGLGGSTPAWNNDLDLEVEVGGQIFRGNGFDLVTGWSEAGAGSDPMNNTEGVFLEAGVSGEIVIRVLASNINSDGVPGVGDSTDQDFALVCYNCGSPEIFVDGFENGNSSVWSVTIP